MKLVLLVLAGVCLMSLAFAKGGTCPINSSTNVVVYGQTGAGGVGAPSLSWMTHFFNWWKTQDSSLNYTVLSDTNVKSDCNLAGYPNLKLYVQPGGDAYSQQRTLGQAGKNNILGFIDSGKAYFGVCAGFYYAANDYYWQGSYYNWPNLLMRFPTVEGSITDIADYDVSPGYAMTSLSNGQNAIYYGGPTRGWRQTPATFPGTANATFSAIPGQLPAVIMDGNMLLTSVHLEAFENDGISGLSTAQRVENYKWLANMINTVANTSFNVPPYTPPDNQSNQTNGSAPGQLFFDGFENGMGAWTLSKQSNANYWAAATDTPYQGAYYALGKPMSTTNPATTMQVAISTANYSNVTVSYYRRLVLTALNDFEAQWFDGTNWNVMESSHGTVFNDAAYAYKQYVLPASAGNNPAFMIRFQCTASAVSKTCKLDNVNVTAS